MTFAERLNHAGIAGTLAIRPVENCSNCDLLQWIGRDSEIPSYCGTPGDEPSRKLFDHPLNDPPPDWCPLRTAPVLIRLRLPETA